MMTMMVIMTMMISLYLAELAVKIWYRRSRQVQLFL